MKLAPLLVLLAALLTASPAAAQETIYNVILGKPVDRGEVFTNEQLTLNREVMSDLYVVYGLGLGADAGLALLNVDFTSSARGTPKLETVASPGDDPLAPILAPTLFKRFEVHETLGVGLSTQTGVGLSSHPHLATLSSASMTLRWPRSDYRLVGGVYYGNRGRLGGEHGDVGWWAGAELALVDKKIHLEAEFISGHHSLSNFIVGPKMFFTDDVDLSIGVLLPAPGSGNPQAMVLQFEVEDVLSHRH